MDYSLLSGIGSYLLTGQGGGVNSLLTNPYLAGLYSSGFNSVSNAGISGVFQSGVRFGQAMEKAAEKNPENAEQLQKILEEAFGSGDSGKKSAAGRAAGSDVAAVYEPSGQRMARESGRLGDYLESRRSSRQQQRLAERQR